MIEQAPPSGSATSPRTSAPSPAERGAFAAAGDGLARLRRLAARLAGHPEALELLGDIDAIALELEARQQATQRLGFLSEVSQALESPSDIEFCLGRVARLVVPRLADACAIYLADERGGSARLVASEHADPRRATLLAMAAATYAPRRGGRRPAERALDTGRAVLLTDVAPELFTDVVAPDMRAQLRPLKPTSWIAVPLRSGARTLGVISLTLAGESRRYGEAELDLARGAFGDSHRTGDHTPQLLARFGRMGWLAPAAARIESLPYFDKTFPVHWR